MADPTENADGLDLFRSDGYVAVGYVQDAKSYCRSADLLAAQDEHLVDHAPIYFLQCHATELFLKAFLLAKGATQKDLRHPGVRHQLRKLLDIAIERGLQPSEHTIAVIDMLAPYHAEHEFRYRVIGHKRFPLMGEVARSLDDLAQQIEPVVVGFLRRNTKR